MEKVEIGERKDADLRGERKALMVASHCAWSGVTKKDSHQTMKLFARRTDNGFHNSRQVAKCPTNLVHGIAGADNSASSRFKIKEFAKEDLEMVDADVNVDIEVNQINTYNDTDEKVDAKQLKQLEDDRNSSTGNV